MKHVILYAAEDRHGTTGLFIEGVPRNDSTDSGNGLTIAHDIVEHVNGFERIGEISDELEAMGAIWMTRGRWGMISRDGGYRSPEENIASDISRMAIDVAHGAYFDVSARPPRTRRHDEDAAFEYIVEIARKGARQELASMMGEFDRRAYALYWDYVLPLMRIGARKLVRRFKDAGIARELFWRIEELVDPLSKHREGYERYALRYEIGRIYASIKEDYHDGEGV